ncbi:MAG: Rieske (2Fe-2S) protein [Rhodobacteraceae bacterium]|nr:Rieske (2Fe-2S) protein [Paracoccaceae bacterium]
MQADERTQWVPAAVSTDILDGTVVPAALPTGPIAVWRTASGELHANGDRCPHRGMRLSHGFVRGNSLSCIYHGWRYGRDGGCEHIPAHPGLEPPKSINCGPLPVAEANGVVWVAAQAPEEAPAEIEGFEALKSMLFCATPAAIAEAAGGALKTELGGTPAHLVTAERTPSETFVVALVPTGTDVASKLAAATALEALRRVTESAT